MEERRRDYKTALQELIQRTPGRTITYKLVREMNEELKKKGFLTIPGRVSRRYFEEKFYGLRDRQ